MERRGGQIVDGRVAELSHHGEAVENIGFMITSCVWCRAYYCAIGMEGERYSLYIVFEK